MNENIRNQILIIEKKIKDLRKEGVVDSLDLEMYFINNMTETYESYPHLIKRLCREEKQDNTYLYKMIDLIEKINNNETTVEEVEKNLGSELARKFLYPEINKLKK